MVSTTSLLDQAVLLTKDLLKALAEGDEFLSVLEMSFGDRLNGEQAGALRQAWTTGDFTQLPEIQIESSSVLQGANGAYAAQTSQIYLSQSYLEANTNNPEAIANVLLEEIGHFVDAKINAADSPGDEGAVFSALVRGEVLSSPMLNQLKTEDDTATITLNNQALKIEQSIDPNYIAALTKDTNNTGVYTWTSNTLTYSFMSALPSGYSSNDYPDFAPLDAQQQAAVVKALATWATVANLNFSPAGEEIQLDTEDIVSSTLLSQIRAEYYLLFGAVGVLSPITGVIGLAIGEVMYQAFRVGLDNYVDSLDLMAGANLKFGSYNLKEGSGEAIVPNRSEREELRQNIADYINSWILSDNLGLQATYEDIDISNVSDSSIYGGGNVFLDISSANAGSQLGIPGLPGFDTLVHEIGHALGLKHPGAYNAGGDNIPPPPYLEAEFDNNRYSVMSYNPSEWQGDVSPSTPMLYDVAAIQQLYGANVDSTSGNDTYSWNPNAPFMMTIWDAGGSDTIDASNQLAFDIPTDSGYSTFSGNSPDKVLTLSNYGVEVDLNPGSFSSIGSISFDTGGDHATNNLAIAFGTIIENAIGSNFADVITGNSASNTLNAGLGDDILNPGLGQSDNVDGGDGDDLLVLDYSAGDTGTGITSSIFNYGTTAGGYFYRTVAPDNGTTLDSVGLNNIERFQVTGSSQNDTLYGWIGNDTINGGAGNDTIDGDQGNDTINGGADDDVISVYFEGDPDKADNLDGGTGIDTLTVDLSNQTVNITLDSTSPAAEITFADGTRIANFEVFKNIRTGSGNDRIVQLGRLDNRFYSGSGNDILNPGLGQSDNVDGGDGDDLLVLDYSAGDTGTGITSSIFNYGTTAGGYFYRTVAPDNGTTLDSVGFNNIERFQVIGSSQNDTLYGWIGNDTINGGAGNDTIDGDQGNDTINGGADDDVISVYFEGDPDKADNLDGGTGIDTLTVDLSNQTVNITLDSTSPAAEITFADGTRIANFEVFKNIRTGSGNDRIVQLGRLDNRFYSGSGNDILNPGLGQSDNVDGGDGDDLLVLDYSAGDTGTGITSSIFNYGTTAGGYFYRTVAPDNGTTLDSVGFNNIERFQVIGSSQNDTLYGWIGNDTINGGAGNDTIDGGGGADSLKGGTGNDTYVLTAATAGGSQIQDDNGSDTLTLSNVTLTLSNLAAGVIGLARADDVLGIDLNQDGILAIADDLTILNFFNSLGDTGSGFIENVANLTGADILTLFTNASPPSLSINNVSFLEENNGTTSATFTVSLSQASTQTITVNYVTANGIASSISDYSANSGTLTFNPGETSKAIKVAINSDTYFEADETFAVNLSGATNATITNPQGIATITNDDALAIVNPLLDLDTTEDATFNFTVPGNTFNTDAIVNLTYTATLSNGDPLPAWLSFDPTTRTFNSTPTNDSVGTLSVKVTATADTSDSASDTFGLKIVNTNDAPVVSNAIANQTATEDSPFSFTIPANTFSDIDAGDVLTYTAALSDGSALPTWLTFDLATGTFSGTPANNSVGAVSLKVTATDTVGAAISSSFSFTIANTNDAPTVASAIADQIAAKGSPFNFTLPINTFSDVDAGDTLTYAATLSNGDPLPTWLSFNPNTRTFSGTPPANTGSQLSLTVTATDIAGAFVSDAFDLTILNVPPVLDLNGSAAGKDFATTFTEDRGAIAAVSNGLTLTDADNTTVTSATITISNLLNGSAESLSVPNTFGYMTANYSSATGTLQLIGTATLAQYQQVLRTLRYNNSAQNPSPTPRQINFVVNDGTADSAVATSTVTINPVNDAPVLDLNGSASGINFNTTFTEDSGFTAIVNSNLSLSDVDGSNITVATVRIRNLSDPSAEFLSVNTVNTNIAATYDATSGVLELRGVDTIANYQQVLRTVTYNNTSQSPTTTSRLIDFGVNDGTANSITATATVRVVSVNDLPVVALTGNSVNFVENGASVVIDNGIRLSDTDGSTLQEATVRITNFVSGQDSLSFTPFGNITGSFSSGVLTLTGTASLEDYQTVLRSVTYSNSSDRPSATPRTIDFVVNDGKSNSLAARSTVAIAPVNDAPVLTVSGVKNFAAINEDPTTNAGTLVSTLLGSAVSDLDTGALKGIAVTDALGAGVWQHSTDGGSNWSNFSPVSKTNALLLASNTRIRFSPELNFNGTVNLSYRAWDQTSGSVGSQTDTSNNGGSTAFSTAIATSSLTINPVNDAPVNTVPDTQAIDEDTFLVFSSANGNPIIISDLEAGSNPVRLTLTTGNGTFQLGRIIGLTAITGNGTASVTATGTLSNLNDALNGLRFNPIANFNGIANLTVTTNDLGNSGSGGARSDSDRISITINPVNDAPVNLLPTRAQTVRQGSSLIFSSTSGNRISISDVDAGTGIAQINLFISDGILALGSTDGLAIVEGNNTNNLSIQGTLPTLTTVLNGLRFTPDLFSVAAGAVTLTINTNDLNSTGSGGVQTDADSLSITVTPANPITGTSSNNNLSGSSVDDLIRGLGGNDTLYGNGGNDILLGGDGNDVIYSAAGDDLINGGLGDDSIWLGGGQDTIVLARGNGVDTIYNYPSGSTRFKLDAGLAFNDLTIAQSGSSTLISTTSGEQLASLMWTQSSSITASSFI